MQCKKAFLIINPHGGDNVAKMAEILAVLSAAGWETEIGLKEYPGHAMELATRAAENKYDLVISYGGDGTLNQVVNGIVDAKGQKSIFGVLPGGTANEWATEVGVPSDPVKAALALVDSEVRKVDIGHVAVQGLALAHEDEAGNGNGQAQAQANGHANGKKAHKPKLQKGSASAKHHFLLMAGLGIDAAIMGQVSKPLKYRIGRLAVGVAAAQKLPEQHPFPIEVRTADDGSEAGILWRGEALQVIVGNTRRYADIVEMTPDAHVDDGILDVCVITAGDPLSTAQQFMSLLTRRKPDNQTAEYFRGAHLSISVPASINLQLDGSTVKLKDYLDKEHRKALKQMDDTEQVMVTYRFDSMPRALRAAIPRSYHNTLFEKDEQSDEGQEIMQGQNEAEADQHMEEHVNDQQNGKHDQEKLSDEEQQQIKQLQEQGRKVTVIGSSPNSAKKHTYHIIAGNSQKQSTGEAVPIAVRADEHTKVMSHKGKHVTSEAIHELKEGDTITVEGDKSRRGVIQATHIVI